MKIYKKDDELPMTCGPHYKRNPVYDELIKLEIGDSLEIEKSEWPYKSDPGPRLAQDFKRKGVGIYGIKFSCKRLMLKDGWLITRERKYDL